MHDEKEHKSFMKTAPYRFPVAVGRRLSWQRDSGPQSRRHMSPVKKGEKKNSLLVINTSMKITIQFGANGDQVLKTK